jgi:hypothetical protein
MELLVVWSLRNYRCLREERGGKIIEVFFVDL